MRRPMRRADATIEFAVAAAREALAPGPWSEGGTVRFETIRFAGLPAEVALRLLGRAVASTGSEGPVELAKLEALYAAMRQTASRLRRTLAQWAFGVRSISRLSCSGRL